MARQVLLVGNGINNIKSTYSWDNLLDDLIGFVGQTHHIRKGNKPFPLLYEELVARAVKNKIKSEAQIQEYIAERIASFQPNDVHRRVVTIRLAGILTTNYDYTLEVAAGAGDQRALVNSGIVQEKRFSLFRFVQTNKLRFWHIHGERNQPRSIGLGYEHYGAYLQRMRNYIVSGTGKDYKKEFEPLEKRIRKGTVRFDSWIDSFFLHDIYVMGLSLDFVEMHLWWLLTYRARRKYTGGLPIKNRITYFYPGNLESKMRDKLELLAANDVHTRMVPFRKDWMGFYNRVLDAVERD